MTIIVSDNLTYSSLVNIFPQHIDKSSIYMDVEKPAGCDRKFGLICMKFKAKYAPFGYHRSSEVAGWEAVARGTWSCWPTLPFPWTCRPRRGTLNRPCSIAWTRASVLCSRKPFRISPWTRWLVTLPLYWTRNPLDPWRSTTADRTTLHTTARHDDYYHYYF